MSCRRLAVLSPGRRSGAGCIALAAGLLALSQQACVIGGVHADGGYLTSANQRAGRQGANLRARAALLPFGLSLRGKVTKNVKQVALEPELIMPAPLSIPIYGALGTHLVQVDSVDGSMAYGMFSPVAELGTFLPLGLQASPRGIGVAGPFVIVNGIAEYDIRFGEAPNELFFSANAGFGFFFSELALRP